MSYANDEARKLAEKSAKAACIDDDVVFGWAVHYFEEDSIEGTLLNEDGSEYKTQPKQVTKSPTAKPAPPKPQPKPQMSMFDLMGENLEGTSAPSEEKPDDEEDDMPSDEEIQEIMAGIAEEEKAEQQKPTVSPVYRKYLDVQDRYPQAIIAMRLGDFYEVFGKNAELLADELSLTLTSRDCGFESRVPMIGFPYHASDVYFGKILSNGHTLVVMEMMTKYTNFLPHRTLTLKRERYSPKKKCASLTATSKNPTLRTMNLTFPLSIPKRSPFWMKCSAKKLH